MTWLDHDIVSNLDRQSVPARWRDGGGSMDGMSIGPIRPGCVLRTLVAPLSSES